MSFFFSLCAVFGGGLLLAQLVFGVFLGADHDAGGHVDFAHAHGHAVDPRAGLNLFSIRSISAGLAFFGLSGLGALHAGWPAWLALPVALVPALLAMMLVAWIMRSMLKLESDGTLRLENALGAQATVYIPIPAGQSGPGRITLALQERTVELPAITRGDALATGTRVTVIDIADGDLLEVVPNPRDEES